MTGSSYLLDTNIISALMKQEPQAADRARVEAAVALPSRAVGEILFGIQNAPRAPVLLAAIEPLLRHFAVMPCDRTTAEHYACIEAALRSKGRPIPENDIWIAAIAVQHNFVLVTRDAHFGAVDQLRLEQW